MKPLKIILLNIPQKSSLSQLQIIDLNPIIAWSFYYPASLDGIVVPADKIKSSN